MGTSTIDRSGGVRWRRWLRAAGAAAPPSAPQRRIEELESELALLREENARLAVERARPRGRPVDERVRELLPVPDARERGDDEPWELMTDCLMLRDGLLDVCREVERAMRETRRRLDGLVPGEADDGGGDADMAGMLLRDDLESVA